MGGTWSGTSRRTAHRHIQLKSRFAHFEVQQTQTGDFDGASLQLSSENMMCKQQQSGARVVDCVTFVEKEPSTFAVWQSQKTGLVTKIEIKCMGPGGPDAYVFLSESYSMSEATRHKKWNIRGRTGLVFDVEYSLDEHNELVFVSLPDSLETSIAN